jgi:hypothetical protein
VKATAEKTTSFLGGIGSAMSQKIGALKNTDSFRSMEERVSSAVSSVKVHVRDTDKGRTEEPSYRRHGSIGGRHVVFLKFSRCCRAWSSSWHLLARLV